MEKVTAFIISEVYSVRELPLGDEPYLRNLQSLVINSGKIDEYEMVALLGEKK